MSDTPHPDMQPSTQSTASKSEIVQGVAAVWGSFREIGEGASTFCWRFLEHKHPSIIFITAFVIFILAALIGQLASVFVPGTEEVMRRAANGQSWTEIQSYGSLQMVSFISACSYFTRIAAMMLAAWALIRLLADAIKDGAKS